MQPDKPSNEPALSQEPDKSAAMVADLRRRYAHFRALAISARELLTNEAHSCRNVRLKARFIDAAKVINDDLRADAALPNPQSPGDDARASSGLPKRWRHHWRNPLTGERGHSTPMDKSTVLAWCATMEKKYQYLEHRVEPVASSGLPDSKSRREIIPGPVVVRPDGSLSREYEFRTPVDGGEKESV